MIKIKKYPWASLAAEAADSLVLMYSGEKAPVFMGKDFSWGILHSGNSAADIPLV